VHELVCNLFWNRLFHVGKAKLNRQLLRVKTQKEQKENRLRCLNSLIIDLIEKLNVALDIGLLISIPKGMRLWVKNSKKYLLLYRLKNNQRNLLFMNGRRRGEEGERDWRSQPSSESSLEEKYLKARIHKTFG